MTTVVILMLRIVFNTTIMDVFSGEESFDLDSSNFTTSPPS
jgi:hypothetical protein